MAKDYSSYDFNPSVLLPGTLKRNGAWPLDMSALFLSVNDAIKYARGDVQDLDERNLGLQAYAGQIIGVKAGTVGNGDNETGLYDAYIIQGDGTLKKLSTLDNSSNEEAVIESSIVNVVIPNVVSDTRPQEENYMLGDYWYDNENQLLYVLTKVNVAQPEDPPQYENHWLLASKTLPFITQDKTEIWVYVPDEQDPTTGQWEQGEPSTEKIYLSTNTSELYYWDPVQEIFTTNNGDGSIVTNSVHFLRADYYVDDTGNFPVLTEREVGKILIKYQSDLIHAIYEWTYDYEDESGEWVQITKPIYNKVIYFPREQEEQYELFLDDYNNDVLPGHNLYVLYDGQDKFQENIFYINDYDGNVYTWDDNEDVMVLLSEEEMSQNMPKRLPEVSCNTTHGITYYNNSSNPTLYCGTYIPLLSAVEPVLNSLVLSAEYTLPVINQESRICTIFNVSVKKEGNKTTQHLYNSDVDYVRMKIHGQSWREWKPIFKKTDITFEVKTVPSYSEQMDNDINQRYGIRDKIICIRVHCDNMEFVRLNEPYLSIVFYAKRSYTSRNHGSSNKWRAIHHNVTNNSGQSFYQQKYSLEYLNRETPYTSYSDASNATKSYCGRTLNGCTYIMPITVKNLMDGFFRIEPISGQDPITLHEVLKYGTGTNLADQNNIKYTRLTIGDKKRDFLLYGLYDPMITDATVTTQNISAIIGMNLVYCKNTKINDTEHLIRTEVLPYKIFAKSRISVNGITDEYVLTNKLVKVIM